MCLAGLTALAVTITTGTASAQFGELAGFTESMQPEFHSRDLTIFAESLDLDKSQKDILKGLFDDYQASFDQGLQNMQERLRSMRKDLEAGDQNRIMALIFEPFEDWSKDRRKLGEDLLVSLEGTLNDRQLELVPGFRRRLLREKEMSRGVLSGESVDLLVIARQTGLGVTETAIVQPLLDEYEIALHDALVARQSLFRSSQTKVIEALQSKDGDRNIKLIEEQMKSRARVRDVNDQYLELIALTLPGDKGGEFRLAAMERGYPKAFRTTPAERMYRAAILIRDLDPDIKQSIIDLQTLYLDDLGFWRENLVEVIREFEPARERNRVEMYSARMRGERPVKLQDPTIAERRKREKLDDQYIQLLQSLLTEEQFLALPGAERWLQRRNAKNRETDPRDREREKMMRKKLQQKNRAGAGDLGVSGGAGRGGTGKSGGTDK
jgi:hypothetical protein